MLTWLDPKKAWLLKLSSTILSFVLQNIVSLSNCEHCLKLVRHTNTDMLSVKQPSTFLILRTPILKERGVPSRPKSHPSIILQWLSHIPSDIIGPNQYCGEPRPMLLVLIASMLSTLGLRCGAFNPWPFCSRFATSF